ncbi:sigma intracellular receptor 2-like [Corticium candelabrum]|uniref:sigma intracellular receptor 2-like n=1 Tax=Corticium candelabrum TaxID=121492 RepID=UPI002E25B323|nr:sigma intracellular receptor 2-like [Corticium candelabrum]
MAGRSLLSRPVDLLIVLVFTLFFLIAISIDLLQATSDENVAEEHVLDRMWPPESLRKLFFFWCNEVDSLLKANPLWYRTLALVSPVVYAPFYVFAIYAFVNQREWIRTPGLCWSWGMILVMFAVLSEQFFGKHATKNMALFCAAYLPYVVFPILFGLRLLMYPTVFDHTNSHDKKES